LVAVPLNIIPGCCKFATCTALWLPTEITLTQSAISRVQDTKSACVKGAGAFPNFQKGGKNEILHLPDPSVHMPGV